MVLPDIRAVRMMSESEAIDRGFLIPEAKPERPEPPLRDQIDRIHSTRLIRMPNPEAYARQYAPVMDGGEVALSIKDYATLYSCAVRGVGVTVVDRHENGGDSPSGSFAGGEGASHSDTGAPSSAHASGCDCDRCEEARDLKAGEVALAHFRANGGISLGALVRDLDPAEAVDHPPHYQGSNGIEVADVVDGFDLGPWDAQAVQYILRHKRKGAPLEDLRKAAWCLAREVARLEGGNLSDEQKAELLREWKRRYGT